MPIVHDDSNREPDQIAPPGRPGHALIVLNPVAGTSSADQVREVIDAAFGERGWTCAFYETTGCDDLTAIVGQAITAGCDLVVAAGGDGTVADVASALVGTSVPLGIIPLGTGNVLSMELGIPQNLRLAAELLTGDHDVCQLDAMRVGNRHFLLQVGVGLDSLLMRDTDRASKRKLGRLAYFLTLVRVLIGYRAKPLTVWVDGTRHRLRAWDVLVANVGTVGTPLFHWSPQICPTDGVLELVVFTIGSPLDVLRLVGHFLLGRPSSHPTVILHPVHQEVTIASRRPLPVQGDGDVIGHTPVTVKLVTQAVRVVVPRESPVLASAGASLAATGRPARPIQTASE